MRSAELARRGRAGRPRAERHLALHRAVGGAAVEAVLPGPSAPATRRRRRAPLPAAGDESSASTPARPGAIRTGIAVHRRGTVRVLAMAQGHKDRLSAVDASFLHQERESSHMHVGAIVILEGPPPTREEFAEHIEARLHLVPRYRQKLVVPALRDGPAVLDRRSALQHRLPRAPHGAALAGLDRAAARPGGPDLLPAPRPLEAAVGDLAGPGPRGRPLRADLEDPPRARGRRRRAWTSPPCCST